MIAMEGSYTPAVFDDPVLARLARQLQRQKPPAVKRRRGRKKSGGNAYSRENARVYMTCVDALRVDELKGLTESTTDPADRAHLVRDSEGLLVPAAKVANARPRRYPRHHMHGPAGARVSCESVLDDLAARQARLRSWGLSVGGAGSMAEMVREALGKAGPAARGLIHRQTRQTDVVTGEEVW